MGKSKSLKTDKKEHKLTQSDKTKFRNTAKWKKFRAYMKGLFENRDPITQKPLHKGWNLHHLDSRAEHYEDIEDLGRFVCLNKETHETIHWLFRYYEKDHSVIDRLKYYLDLMEECSNDKRD